MRGISTVLVVFFVIGSAVAGPAAGLVGSADAEPSVEVTVDGSSVADGGRHETNGNDRITVDAAVNGSAPEGTTLEEVVVRVDGEREASRSVNGTTATERVRPHFDPGNNTVRVIVTDTAGAVNSTEFTVYKDSDPPHVFLTEPYETRPWYDITDGNVTGTNHTLSGELLDDSTVDRVTVTHEVGDYRNVVAQSDPGENVSVPLDLGYTPAVDGTNRLRIDVSDEFGNTRTYRFSIDATDGESPSISTGPLPNETANNRVSLAGTVTDDVWVASAEVTVESLDNNESTKTTTLVDREYDATTDGRTLEFEEDVFTLYPGTYRVTVNATDVAGNSTSESYTVERIPSEELDRSPNVTVDRDRTVVTGPETLFLSGSSFEGVTRRLVVETRDATGETLDYQVVYSGDGREQVEFDREVTIGEELTTVIVRATGPDGTEVTERFRVNGSSREAFVDEVDTGETVAYPTVSVTHLQDERPGTASSSLTVRRAPAGATVTAPPADGPATVAGTANVTLSELDLSVASETDLTGTVVVRDRDAGGLAAPPDADSAGTVSIQHSVDSEQVDELGMTVEVDRSYLDAHGFDPADLSVYRESGGNWSQLETTLVSADDDGARYRVESPGLSVFALAQTAPENATDGTGGGDDEPDEDNETDGDEETDGGTADIFVTNVTVNRTEVEVNESVMVNATLRNEGDATGTYTATLHTRHGLNRTFVAEEAVEVPPGEERTARFTTQFDQPGNHTASVNGTQAGPVVVSEGGGLLSVFSFIPLRLVGLLLGGVVGLLVVLTLVRFVLRRVGDDGSEAGG